MFRKILLAYDGSAGAKRAFDVALELAHTYGAELWALAVEERLPHFAATIDETVEAKEFANHYSHEFLSAAYLHTLKGGVELKSEIRADHAARTIVDFTKEGNFDLVVLESSGHSKVWEMFLGTTTEKVSRHVPCSSAEDDRIRELSRYAPSSLRFQRRYACRRATRPRLPQN